MQAATGEPAQIVERAARLLAAGGLGLTWAKVIIVGAGHPAGAAGRPCSPALRLMAGLLARGAFVTYYDPLVPWLRAPGGYELRSAASPAGAEFDLAVIRALRPGADYRWLAGCPRVLDLTSGRAPVPVAGPQGAP
jgi:UDP-N-acetyl-D-glucosamine dehydrogenase